MRRIALVVLAAVASPSLAQEGMYAGIGIGTFDYTEDSGFFTPEEFSDSVSAWRIYGGFEFNEHFAAEIRYGGTSEIASTTSGTDPILGDYTATVDTDFTFTTVLAMGMLPKDWGALIGGIGYFDAAADANLMATTDCCGDLNAGASFDDNGLAAVLGVEWRFGRFNTGIGLRLEYEWLDLDSADASTIGVGISYRF